MISLDAIDRRILRELQTDATIPVAELAERVGLSQTPCWKRVKRLTDEGVIARKVALLDREKLDLGLVVFVSLKTSRHDEAWLAQFARGASALPEVVEIYRLAGETDYLLKVVGMSMKNAGILDGDMVAVHRTPNVRNRQIIVARLEDEVTVKRYRQEGPVVWLLPENEDFEPIKVDLKQQHMLIEGVVVGVIRRGKGMGL